MKKIIIFIFIFIFISFAIFGLELKTEFQDSAPKYFTKEGKIIGICVDIIAELNKRLKPNDIIIILKDKSNPFIPFKRLQSDLEVGDIDIFVGFAKDEKRANLYKFIKTPAYMVQSTFAKLKKDKYEFTTKESLAGKKIAFIAGSATGDQISKVENIIGDTSDNLEVALQKLAEGRVDLVFYHTLGMGYSIKELGFSNKITFTKKAFEEYAHYIALSKKVPDNVIVTVEKVLQEMTKKGIIDKILKKYIL